MPLLRFPAGFRLAHFWVEKDGQRGMLCTQVLGLSFRARELTLVAAGLAPVRVTGVENVNLNALVKAHVDYSANMDAILDLLGFAGD